ncbi:MAG: hypothetical protein DCC73_11335 [Proteobacteria bacterium]|nr:MAG: hypothetical protein DCC73_11335 [Pseudomonadota bacterium]
MPRRPRPAYPAVMLLVVLAGCATRPEPVTIYKTETVKVPVAAPCPAAEVPATPGPDHAPAGATIFAAAQWATVRIKELRAEAIALREQNRICKSVSPP